MNCLAFNDVRAWMYLSKILSKLSCTCVRWSDKHRRQGLCRSAENTSQGGRPDLAPMFASTGSRALTNSTFFATSTLSTKATKTKTTNSSSCTDGGGSSSRKSWSLAHHPNVLLRTGISTTFFLSQVRTTNMQATSSSIGGDIQFSHSNQVSSKFLA